MAKDKNDTSTMEIDDTKVDRAAKAVREFQKGKVNAGYPRVALRALNERELRIVSIGTRLPLAALEDLKGPDTTA